MILRGEDQSTWRTMCTSATLCIVYSIRTGVRRNPGFRDETQATNLPKALTQGMKKLPTLLDQLGTGKGRGKVHLEQAMKSRRGSIGIAVHFL